MVGRVHSLCGHEAGDPGKVAQVILRLRDSDRLPARLLIGRDAVWYAGERSRADANGFPVRVSRFNPRTPAIVAE